MTWKSEFFAGIHYYNLYNNDKKVMFAGYTAEELSNGTQKIVVDSTKQVVSSHTEAREAILKEIQGTK